MSKARIDFSAPLVSTAWLNAHLEADNVRIIDGTYFLPNIQRNAAIEYEAEHIPGACFFDDPSLYNFIRLLYMPFPHATRGDEGTCDGGCRWSYAPREM